MTWANPSGVLIQFRTQLLACATISAVPMVVGDFHYPEFAAAGITPDTLPACLLQEGRGTRERYAEGAVGLIGGTLKASFYFKEAIAVNAGYMETFSRDLIKDLSSQYYGLPFRDWEVTLSSEPKPAARGAGINNSNDLYRAVTITVQYGLTH